ncbi:MAG: hypothetical protein PHC70_02675 [Patescibacteria group bacterium]|nr:hypothetical protein [Patescibacteria group bacterium]
MDLEQVNFPLMLIRRIRISRALGRERYRQKLQYWKQDKEILEIAKREPCACSMAIVFGLAGSGQLDVWIDPGFKPSCEDPDSIHYELHGSLQKYLKNILGKLPEFRAMIDRKEYISSAVYGYANGTRLLALDSASLSPEVPRALFREVGLQTPLATELLSMVTRYRFSGFHGGREAYGGFGWVWCRGTKADLEEDGFIIPSFDELRQDSYLWLVAKRHNLSYSSYLRFRCRALSAHAANQSCDYESLIKEM